MSTIGTLFVGVLALIGVAILIGGIVEGDSATMIAGGFWLGFALVVWFVGYRRDQADRAKDAIAERFARLQNRQSAQPPESTYEVIDSYPVVDEQRPPRRRRRELMETKRDLLLEEELEDEIEELEERARSRRLGRRRDTRRLPPGSDR